MERRRPGQPGHSSVAQRISCLDDLSFDNHDAVIGKMNIVTPQAIVVEISIAIEIVIED